MNGWRMAASAAAVSVWWMAAESGHVSATDPHLGMMASPARDGCRTCHLPTHPADQGALDVAYCSSCHRATRTGDETRMLPPIDRPPGSSMTRDRPLAIKDDMVQIPAGSFLMGYDHRHPDEAPMRHAPVDQAYWIDRHEVTNQAYRRFITNTGRTPPNHWREGSFQPGDERLPVAYIDWYDAEAYCAWAGKRLPTETEWEKAARGTDGRLFPWGDTFDAGRTNSPQARIGRLMPIGSFPTGQSPYGLHDMAGNVWEWTGSWYQPYPGNSHASVNYGERYKVVRGGSYVDCSFYRCGLSAPTFNRGFFKRETKNSGFGVRCAR